MRSRLLYCDESECCRIVQSLPTPLVPIFVAWLADDSRRAAEAALKKIIGTLGAIAMFPTIRDPYINAVRPI